MRERLQGAALALGLLLLLGADARGLLGVQDEGRSRGVQSASASSVTATTQVLGASGASLSYYLTDVTLSCGPTASTISVVSSTTAGNACATSPATVVPTVPLAINGALHLTFQTPLKVAANSAVCCKTSGSTAFSCLVSGYVAP